MGIFGGVMGKSNRKRFLDKYSPKKMADSPVQKQETVVNSNIEDTRESYFTDEDKKKRSIGLFGNEEGGF